MMAIFISRSFNTDKNKKLKAEFKIQVQGLSDTKKLKEGNLI